MQFNSGLSFLVTVWMEGLDFLVSSQILCPPAYYFSLYSDSKFRLYTSRGLAIVTWRCFEMVSVQCRNLKNLGEDAMLVTVQRNTWHYWMGFFEIFQWNKCVRGMDRGIVIGLRSFFNNIKITCLHIEVWPDWLVSVPGKHAGQAQNDPMFVACRVVQTSDFGGTVENPPS